MSVFAPFNVFFIPVTGGLKIDWPMIVKHSFFLHFGNSRWVPGLEHKDDS